MQVKRREKVPARENMQRNSMEALKKTGMRMERRGGDTMKIYKGVAGKAKGNIA